MRILTVNAGSATFKVAMVDHGRSSDPQSFDAVLTGPAPDAVAHRVVHGGNRMVATLLDDAVVAELGALADLAPLHQPPALAAVERCRRAWPEVPNIACFDTAFHATIPDEARTYAIPARYRDRIRAYGFHGLSHAWAADRVARLAPDARRVLVAHLGGGQSMCAVLDGRSVMTTMGFTPLDGLVMATRSGAIDPGAVLWLAEHGDDEVEDILARQSGLLGLCGTDDMREVHRRAEGGDADAAFAFAVWRHRAVTVAGSCVAALGGLDALVFTGGIGERDPRARAAIAEGLAWLGVALGDDGRVGERELTAPGAAVRSFTVAAREDLRMADEAMAVLGAR